MRSKHIITLLFSLLSLSNLTAQEENSRITTRVDLVSMGEPLHGLYLGKNKQKIATALPFRYHTTLRYKGNRIIEISQSTSSSPKEPALSEEDKKHESKPIRPEDIPTTAADQTDKFTKAIAKRREKNPDLVALAVVPSGARHITVLLTPAKNNTYRTTVINDGPTKLPFGKLRVHNFCEHPIFLRFDNDKPVVIPPKKNKQAAPQKNNSLRYLLGYQKGKRRIIEQNNFISVSPTEQVQMVILRSNSSFFQSANGSRGGNLQVAILRRNKALKPPPPGDPARNNDKPPLPDGFNQ